MGALLLMDIQANSLCLMNLRRPALNRKIACNFCMDPKNMFGPKTTKNIKETLYAIVRSIIQSGFSLSHTAGNHTGGAKSSTRNQIQCQSFRLTGCQH